jgi:hypothetical protein
MKSCEKNSKFWKKEEGMRVSEYSAEATPI